MSAVRDYDDLIAAFKARADEIGVSTSWLDYATGLPSGYVGKLFGPSRVKMIGLDSLWPIAEVLAVEITITPSLELAQKMASRWEKRDELRRRPGVVRKRFSPEVRAKVMSEIGRLGGSMPKRLGMTSQLQRRRAKRGWKTRKARRTEAIDGRGVARCANA